MAATLIYRRREQKGPMNVLGIYYVFATNLCHWLFLALTLIILTDYVTTQPVYKQTCDITVVVHLLYIAVSWNNKFINNQEISYCVE